MLTDPSTVAATICASRGGASVHRTVMHGQLRRILRGALLGIVVFAGLFGVLQLVPYGQAHTNPPIIAEPLWDSPRTRELARRACFDCHSNETRWPWYANVAPFSWVMQNHVEI